MGTIYKPKGKPHLYMQFQDGAGKWKQKSTKLLAGESVEERKRQRRRAKTMLDKIESQIAAGVRFGESVGGVRNVERYAEHWISEREERGLACASHDKARLRHAMPYLGPVLLHEVRVRHLRDVMRILKQRIGRDKVDLSPRTVLHIYRTLHTMFEDAVSDELIDTNPCKLKKSELPKKIDKDPEWRSQAVFTRGEVETILSDDEMPWDRRVLNTILALTGMRFGEVSALRWRAIDATPKPLSMISVHASYDATNKCEKSVKNGVPRRVPVHPVLAKVLAEWKLKGWEEYMGRMPQADDLIVPSPRGKNRGVGHGRVKFHEDLDRLDLRRRRQHDLRRTFISLCRTDGARKDILNWISHGPSDDIMDTYSTFPWKALCDEVLKLRIERREGKVIAMPRAALGGSNGDECAGPYYRHAFPDSSCPESKAKVAEMQGNRTLKFPKKNPRRYEALQRFSMFT